MSFIDIVFTALLGYALYNGLKNGLFVEIANFTGLRVETVIRTFAKMKSTNKIEIINHKIYF